MVERNVLELLRHLREIEKLAALVGEFDEDLVFEVLKSYLRESDSV